ncbi:BLOC-1-related complex subunit 6-like isoform X2 [Strongylocentrotus purpuratus]|uniref:BLOC-1-related complex subunit 6 C-terminal helix domain-containing protein n=1 Tax=Strongylocentrotus purpuratus TaxID=7668 RepID=A0A7M7PWG1_STRPU|nr:BLOC-1-related complex subunit 6-like isoform X2 [Strongylocentrotus purpuratus]
MDGTESPGPLPARGEAEGAQSTDESTQKTSMQKQLWDEEETEGDQKGDGEGRLECDPLAEAAMNILRTQKQQKDPDEEEDDAFLDYGDSDSIGSGKHVEHIDCAVGCEQKLADVSKQLDDLHIDIPEPMVKLKRRSSSIAELSDVEATGSVERFSPREDPVGSAMGSLPLHATTPPSMTSSSSSATELGVAVGPSAMIPPIDPEAIQDLEKQCHMVADNLNLMLGHLSNSLHNMSAITVGHIQTYRDAVEKAGITVDHSVKAMYALMAKVEELNFSMPMVYDLAKQIKSINSQLDELESLCK